MNIASFSRNHPQSYRRLLVISCITMTASGLYSAANGNTPKILAMGQLARPLPHQELVTGENNQLASKQTDPSHGLTRLPGKDGSGTVPQTATLASSSAAPLNDMRVLGRMMSAARFGDGHWPALNNLWTRESNWNPTARNASSGACGIPQALPCSKIPDMSPSGQIIWGLTYIERRYGTPTSAWQHWQRHHWY